MRWQTVSDVLIQIKRCRTCKALGVGPNAVKLWPLNGQLYCKAHWSESLQWEEQISQVIRGLESIKSFHREVTHPVRKRPPRRTDWRGYIWECAGLAGLALEHGDKKTFTHYASRAILAWGLKEVQDARANT